MTPSQAGTPRSGIALREAGEGDVDEFAAPAVERGVVEPQGGRGTRAHVLQHHVGFGRAIAAGAPRRLVLEVDLDEALAAVEQRVDGVSLAARPHDLDHVRPLVGEQHRGHPARPASAKIEHPHRRKRRGPFLSGSRRGGRHVLPPQAHPVGGRGGRGRSAAAGVGADCSRRPLAAERAGRARSGRSEPVSAHSRSTFSDRRVTSPRNAIWRVVQTSPKSSGKRGEAQREQGSVGARGTVPGRTTRRSRVRGRSACARHRHSDEGVPSDEMRERLLVQAVRTLGPHR